MGLKLVSMAPLPAMFFEQAMKQNGISDITVVDVSKETEDAVIAAVSDADFIIGDFTFRNSFGAIRAGFGSFTSGHCWVEMTTCISRNLAFTCSQTHFIIFSVSGFW